MFGGSRVRTSLWAAAAAAMAACGSAEPEASSPGDPQATSAAAEYPTPDGAWAVHQSEFEPIMQRARAEGWNGLPLGPRATAFGRSFLGAPYVAHTLEMPGDERLVVNLKELDCVTLVENALALAYTSAGTGSFGEFLQRLERLRYRDGALRGYTSRLHYFSDWLADAEAKGLVRNVTRDLGGEPLRKRIHFMTSNRNAYRQLRDDPVLVDSMRRVEERLNGMELYWIPQERIAEAAPGIEEGDIIAITTRVEGLDVSHTGFATWVDGRLHLLHAPDVGQPVEVSSRPLAERIQAMRQQTGIMVARPLEPRR
jgi:hypothetical protein